MTPKIMVLAFAAAAGLAFAVHAEGPAASKGPSVDITAPADRSRVPWGSQAPYAVTVNYDGKSTKFGEIASNDVVLRASFAANADAPSKAGTLPEALVQISRSNCSGCHDFTANSAGPSFAAIGKRYAGQASAVGMLAAHIRNGSHGSWGGGGMPPHPDVTPAQATAIAQWIVTQAGDPAVQYAIGKSGAFRMSAPHKPGPRAGMLVSAFFTGPLKPGDTRTAAAGRNTVVVFGTGS
jgi:cytochrome c551/c552